MFFMFYTNARYQVSRSGVSYHNSSHNTQMNIDQFYRRYTFFLQVQCQEAEVLNDLNAFEEEQVVDDYVEEEVETVRLYSKF